MSLHFLVALPVNIFLIVLSGYAQVAVGTTQAANSAIFELKSSEKGFLPPRMTTAQRNAIADPELGLTIYNTDELALNSFNGNLWESARFGPANTPCLNNLPFTYGGSGGELLSAVDMDSSGNYYLGGGFQGTTIIDTATSTSAGGLDLFLAKTNSKGKVLWRQFIGTPGFETLRALKIGSGGDLFICCSFSGTITLGNFTITQGGTGSDFFVACLNKEDGSYKWVKKGNVSSSTDNIRMNLSENDDIYAGGRYSGTLDPGTVASITSTNGDDLFLMRLDKTGSIRFLKSAGGPGTDQLDYLTSKGAFTYFTGTFSSSITIGPDNLTGNSDVVFGAIDSSGTFLWGKKAGGGAQDFAGPVVITKENDIIFSGTFPGANFSIGGTNYNSTGALDIAYVKYSPSGNVTWTQKFGGTATETQSAYTISPEGKIFVSGQTAGSFSLGGNNLTSCLWFGEMDPANGNFLWTNKATSIPNFFSGPMLYKNYPYPQLVFGGRFANPIYFGTENCNVRNSVGNTDIYVGLLTTDGKFY